MAIIKNPLTIVQGGEQEYYTADIAAIAVFDFDTEVKEIEEE